MSEIQEIKEDIKTLEDRLEQLEEQETPGVEPVEPVSNGDGFNRRAAIAALFGIGGLLYGTNPVTAQNNANQGAACVWRGDQSASGYGLYNLSVLHGSVTGGNELTNIAGSNLTIDNDGVLHAGEIENGESFESNWEEEDGTTLTPVSPYTGIDIERIVAGADPFELYDPDADAVAYAYNRALSVGDAEHEFIAPVSIPELNDGGVVNEGDGTDRTIWVIENGASDPSGAGPDDIIFEEEE